MYLNKPFIYLPLDDIRLSSIHIFIKGSRSNVSVIDYFRLTDIAPQIGFVVEEESLHRSFPSISVMEV